VEPLLPQRVSRAAVAASNDEIIVITGATAGVGRATAHAFARAGARIALLGRGERGLAGVKREVEARHAEALAIRTDVGDWAQVYAAARQVQETWGRIDIWVNNAMLTVFGPISALSPDDLRRVTDVTFLGAAYGTMAALEVMRPRNSGVIVQVGSALAYRAIPLQAAYCAGKHALRGFTDSLRCELLHERSDVHVTSVHLSAFNTPQFDWARNLTGRRAQPVPPIFQPELAAEAIVWAARHRRREVFVGWPALKAVVANKIAPGLLDRYLAKSGYSGQLTDDPRPPDACENLHHPCDTDPGAHGRFDARASKRSVHWFLTSHRGAAVAVGIAAALAAVYAAWTR
jgi:NAD(P)-dependent dehydrogenase (short-subunit alcohol dehydrogenase family)